MGRGGALTKSSHSHTHPTYCHRFQFGSPFERELKREVLRLVPRDRQGATLGWWFRCLCYGAGFAYLQYHWIVDGGSYSWRLAVLFGVSKALVGMNIQHDANHGALSMRHSWINDWIGYATDMIGGNKVLWQEQHWMHHAFTNHHEHDPDAFAAEPWLVFRKLHNKRNPWQAWFFFPVMAMYWFSQVLGVDQLVDMQHRGAKEAGLHMGNEYTRRRRNGAILLRAMYVYLNIVRPFQLHGGVGWEPLAQIFLMGISGSLVLGTLFAISHNFETAHRPQHQSPHDPLKPACWYKSQVESSCNYGGWLAGWLTGGLNFQIEHHLFPRMSSAWYPLIAPTVRRICLKHGVQYTHFPTLWQSLVATLKFLHSNGQPATDLNPTKLIQGQATPSMTARYACASVMVAIFAAWGQYTFGAAQGETKLPVGNDIHSWSVPVVSGSLYVVSLPVVKEVCRRFLWPIVDMRALLTEAMIVYNVGQVLLNGWMAYRMVDELVGGHPWIGGAGDLVSPGMTAAIWVHYVDKYLEFMDTYFMVLRGKMDQVRTLFRCASVRTNSSSDGLCCTPQVSFLHVYHHVSISLAWWLALRMSPGGDSYFGALMNSLIHVMMYSYYALALLKIQCPWKRYLTQAQLLQFVLVLSFSILSYALQPSGALLLPYFVQFFEMLSLLVLFMMFYRKAYQGGKDSQRAPAQIKSTAVKHLDSDDSDAFSTSASAVSSSSEDLDNDGGDQFPTVRDSSRPQQPMQK